MLKVNKKLEYALLALQYICRTRGRLVPAREVALAQGSSGTLTAKVLQRLAAAGFLASEQGVSGGYRATELVERSSLLDLYRAVLGLPERSACIRRGTTDCGDIDDCGSMAPMRRLDERITAAMGDTSLAELLQLDHAEDSTTGRCRPVYQESR